MCHQENDLQNPLADFPTIFRAVLGTLGRINDRGGTRIFLRELEASRRDIYTVQQNTRLKAIRLQDQEQRLQDQGVLVQLAVHSAWKVKSKVQGKAEKIGRVQKLKKLVGCF